VSAVEVLDGSQRADVLWLMHSAIAALTTGKGIQPVKNLSPVIPEGVSRKGSTLGDVTQYIVNVE